MTKYSPHEQNLGGNDTIVRLSLRLANNQAFKQGLEGGWNQLGT